jgi:zinc/manganese transport system substrate-binding protein
MVKWITGLAASVSLLLLLSACGSASNSSSGSNTAGSSGKLKVVAAENFYGDVAKAVGGDNVTVTNILNNPNVDPHDFEPTPDTARTVSKSQIIIYNGIGYDAWMGKLITADSSASSKTIIKVADDLMGKKEGDNEHVWYDPETMPRLAKKLADIFSKAEPSKAQTFQKNAQTYIASLQPLQEKVQKMRQSSNVMIDVSEPIFDYMANALHLDVNDVRFATTIDNGSEPSASEIIQLERDFKEKRIKFFVYNTQNSSPAVDDLVKMAESSGIPIVRVTETKPKGKNYLQWMSDQLDQVSKALRV